MRVVEITSKHVKIVAIVAIVILEAINLLTARYDSNILLTLGAIIGGLAGYEYGRWRSREEKA